MEGPTSSLSPYLERERECVCVCICVIYSRGKPSTCTEGHPFTDTHGAVMLPRRQYWVVIIPLVILCHPSRPLVFSTILAREFRVSHCAPGCRRRQRVTACTRPRGALGFSLARAQGLDVGPCLRAPCAPWPPRDGPDWRLGPSLPASPSKTEYGK